MKSHYCFRQWFIAYLSTSHYGNQSWRISQMHASTSEPQWVKEIPKDAGTTEPHMKQAEKSERFKVAYRLWMSWKWDPSISGKFLKGIDLHHAQNLRRINITEILMKRPCYWLSWQKFSTKRSKAFSHNCWECHILINYVRIPYCILLKHVW